MTFVLAPLDYRRSTETVKTIVEHFQEAFGAGFQPLPKYGELGKDETGKSNISLEGPPGSVQESL